MIKVIDKAINFTKVSIAIVGASLLTLFGKKEEKGKENDVQDSSR